ncbi:MAG: hypothetical protein ACRDD1_21795, partial [Planctomycetia bacterium]
AHAANVSLDAVLSGIDILTTAKARMRGSPHAQVLLEVAVVRLARLGELLPVAELAKRLVSGGEFSLPIRPAGAIAARSNTVAAPSADPSKKNAVARTDPPRPPVESPQVPTPQAFRAVVTVTAETLPGIWERVLQEVGPVRGNHLRLSGAPAIVGPNSLAIRFPTEYTSAYEGCASETGTAAIATAVRRVTGIPWTIRIEQQSAFETANEPLPPPNLVADRKKDLLQLPLFRRANEVLGAQLMKVDDGFATTAPAAQIAPAVPAPDTDPEPDEV